MANTTAKIRNKARTLDRQARSMERAFRQGKTGQALARPSFLLRLLPKVAPRVPAKQGINYLLQLATLICDRLSSNRQHKLCLDNVFSK